MSSAWSVAVNASLSGPVVAPVRRHHPRPDLRRADQGGDPLPEAAQELVAGAGVELAAPHLLAPAVVLQPGRDGHRLPAQAAGADERAQGVDAPRGRRAAAGGVGAPQLGDLPRVQVGLGQGQHQPARPPVRGDRHLQVGEGLLELGLLLGPVLGEQFVERRRVGGRLGAVVAAAAEAVGDDVDDADDGLGVQQPRQRRVPHAALPVAGHDPEPHAPAAPQRLVDVLLLLGARRRRRVATQPRPLQVLGQHGLARSGRPGDDDEREPLAPRLGDGAEHLPAGLGGDPRDARRGADDRSAWSCHDRSHSSGTAPVPGCSAAGQTQTCANTSWSGLRPANTTGDAGRRRS
jgi:hypothetical protein